MIMGVLLFMVAVLACLVGSDYKEAAVLYYDADESSGFRVTVSSSEDEADGEDESSDESQEDEGKVKKGSQETLSALKQAAKSSDPVSHSAQDIYDRMRGGK